MRRAVALLVGSLAWNTGCVAWHTGTAALDAHSTAAAQRLRIDVDINFDVGEGLKLSEEQRKKAIEKISGYAKEIFEKSGNYQLTPRDQADFILKVDIVDSGDPKLWLAVISGATLVVLPFWATDDYAIEVELTSKDGKKLGKRSIQESETLVGEVLLLLAMPFAGPWYATNHMWQEVFTDLEGWSDTTIGGQQRAPSATAAANANDH